jgi:hypothetical protein
MCFRWVVSISVLRFRGFEISVGRREEPKRRREPKPSQPLHCVKSSSLNPSSIRDNVTVRMSHKKQDCHKSDLLTPSQIILPRVRPRFLRSTRLGLCRHRQHPLRQGTRRTPAAAWATALPPPRAGSCPRATCDPASHSLVSLIELLATHRLPKDCEGCVGSSASYRQRASGSRPAIHRN